MAPKNKENKIAPRLRDAKLPRATSVSTTTPSVSSRSSVSSRNSRKTRKKKKIKVTEQGVQALAVGIATDTTESPDPNLQSGKFRTFRPKQIQISFPVEKEAADIVGKRFPAYEFNYKQGSPHSHPLSSIERRMLEEKVFQSIDSKLTVVDIGGNVQRHVAAKRNVHSCNPTLSAEDNNRNFKWRQMSKSLETAYDDTLSHTKPKRYMHTFVVPNTLVTWCTHRVEECKCAQADVYTSIHSIYYLSPSDVLTLVHRSNEGLLVAVAHLFPDVAGTFFDYSGSSEAHYELDNNNKVSMSVNGNARPYTHPNPIWLQSLYYEEGGIAMSWDIQSRGDSHVIRFIVCQLLNTKAGRMKTLYGALSDKNHYGEITTGLLDDKEKLIKCGFEGSLIRESKFVSCGNLMFVYGQDKQCVVPKGVIDRVAIHLVGRERTKDLYQECVSRTRKELSNKKYMMPENIRTQSVIMASAMAFTRYLHEEAGVLDYMVRSNKTFFQRLASAIKFETPGCWMPCSNIGNDSDPVDRYNNMNGASSCNLELYSEVARPYVRVEVEQEYKPLRDKAFVRIAYDTLSPKRGEMHQIGTGFVDHIPVIPASKVEHEIISLRNRACQDTPKENPEIWSSLLGWLDEPGKFQRSLLSKKEVIPSSFEEWNAGFPPGRRKEHIKAKEELDRVGLEDKDVIRKMFIKAEKYNKSTIDGTENFDPRAIQGTSHKANVALGPWIGAFNKVLKSKWNYQHNICYASGMTAEQIGGWFKYSMDKLGGEGNVTFAWCDYSRFDGTQQKGCYELEKKIYKRYNIQEHEDAYTVFKAQKFTRGYSRFGVQYQVKYTRKSGDPNTACGNSMINGTTCAYTMDRLGIKHYRGIFIGDDMFMIISNNQPLSNLKEGYEHFTRELGFSPKFGMSTNISDAEFCSGLFWPVGEDEYVLGAKPGRLAIKMGFSVKKLTQADVEGTFNGYTQNHNHVPIVRILATHMNSNTDKLIVEQYKINTSQKHEVCQRTKAFFQERYGRDYVGVERTLKGFLDRSQKQALLPSKMLDFCVEIDN